MTLSTNVFSHGTIEHNEIKIAPKNHENLMPTASTKQIQDIYYKINTNYKKTIKPIFKRTCFNCHGSKITYPWYYKIPVIKQYIDYDIKEAKKHLDFSNDFPFSGHDTPENDLKAVLKSLKEDSMPPLAYSFMHSKERITDTELKIVMDWIKTSVAEIKGNE